jgi:5-methylcytosine-specific restriction protein A
MPRKPLRPCNSPSCPELTHDTYCDDHKKDKYSYDRQRGSSSERGYNAKWRKARLRYLKKNPLCVECLQGDRIEPATVVDHIQAHKGDKELFWDEDNWQSLCESHHNSKTRREDMGSW